MPKLFHLDDYDSCISNNKNSYCVVNIKIIKNVSSLIWKIIEKYSKPKLTQFDHSHLTYGICIEKYSIDKKIQKSLIQNFINSKILKNYKVDAIIETEHCESKNDKNCDKKDKEIEPNLEFIMTLIFMIVSLNFLFRVLFKLTNLGEKFLFFIL